MSLVKTEAFFMSGLVRLEQFYFWVICLMAFGGFLLGLIALLLMWRLHKEITLGTLEFRLRHEELSKRIRKILKALNLPENGSTPIPKTKEEVKT